METFKIRASRAGVLAQNPKKSADLLAVGSKTYVKQWLKEQLYGMRKRVSTKYMEKGIMLEDEAIDHAITWCDLPFVIKNEQMYEDEYFTGTPDIITDDTVVDTKVSWDFETFPLFEDEIPDSDYFYQLQVYMHLTGRRKAKLVYILLNTPEYFTFEQIFDYSLLDRLLRCKVYDVEYDAEVIAMLTAKVINAREYIEQLLNSINK
jgi:hypothetical protein